MYSLALPKQALRAVAHNIGVHAASFKLCKAARNCFTCECQLMSKLFALMQYIAAFDTLSRFC